MDQIKLRNDGSLPAHETGKEADLQPEQAVSRLRAVHRATAELKRGVPVLLLGEAPLVLLPAETAGALGLREFAGLAAAPGLLLLAPVRAAAVLQRPVLQRPVLQRGVASGASAIALRLSPALFNPSVLHGLADPTAEQMLPEPPVPVDAPALAPEALALTKLAGLLPAVLAAPARPDAIERAGRMELLSVAAADVAAYPIGIAADIKRVAEAALPLENAPDARIVAFRAPDAGVEHFAILIGRPDETSDQVPAPLVRLHSECFTGDLLGSLRCDCGAQLQGAIRRIAAEGAGAVLYLAQEGRGIGIANKLRAYALQDRGLDTVDANRALGWGADERNFLVAATMLDELGLNRVRLLTNNPNKVTALEACGITVESREEHEFAPNGVNDQYLATKAERFGHLLGAKK